MRRLLGWLCLLPLLIAGSALAQTPAATPALSLATGTYTMPQSVTITDSTSGATIDWCYSASAITSCSGVSNTTTYSAAIYVNPATASETICSYATASGYAQSAYACATYTPTGSGGGGGSGVTANPVFSLAGGAYMMPTNTTITDATSGATITWCYAATAITSCSGVSNATSYTGSIYINPTSQETLCASANTSGGTVSGNVCQTYTVATSSATIGDSRTVVEPTIPSGCTLFPATKFSVSTTTVNVDPFNATASNPGVLGSTGGTSLEPSSCSGTYNPVNESCTGGYAASENSDWTALQALLKGSPSNLCVELAIGSGGQNAIVLPPWHPTSNVTFVVDPGTTTYASRNPSDYNAGSGNCGTDAGSSCYYHWLTTDGSSSTGAAIMGYGLFDARAWDRFLNNSAASGFGYNRIQTYCNNHGKAINGSPACSPISSSTAIAYGPDMFHLKAASNFTAYKIMLKDCDNFCLYWGDNSDGFTGWGLKIYAPFEMSNSDGFDPSYKATDWTLAYSFLSVGDNQSAPKSDCGSSCGGYTAGATSNGTYLHDQTYAGIGIELGYNTRGGMSSIFSNYLVQKGNQNNSGQAEGHGIKTPDSEGGTVSKVLFQNTCSMDETRPIIYAVSSGTMVTSIQDLNDTILNGPVTGNSGHVVINGTTGTPGQVALNNVTANGSISGSAFSNATVSGQNVSFSSSISGSGVTNNVTNPGGNTPFPCTPTTWQPLVGDLVMATMSASNQQCKPGAPCTFTSATPITLQAIIHPASDISTKESAALTNPITFYDYVNGSSSAVNLGTAGIGYNGMTAMLPITAGTGSHVYTATYYSDSNYPTYQFGNLNVLVGAPAPSIAPGPGAYSTPATITIADSGATSIWYTTDGSTPSNAGGTSISYSAPFPLTLPATVKAIGVFSGGTSAVTSSAFTVSSGGTTVVTPPALGMFTPGP